MEQHVNTFSPLLIVVGLAFVVPFIVAQIKWVRIPIVVGEILIGILIGKSGLDLVAVDSALEFLSTFGLAYLMFLSGLEINFRVLMPAGEEAQKQRFNPLMVGTGMFLLILLFSGIASIFMYRNGMILSPYLMPLILSSTSLAVAVPILKQTGALTTLYGQVVLAAALISDFGTMVLITLVVSLTTSGSGSETLLLTLLFLALYMVYAGARRLRNLKILEEFEHATAQIGVRGALTLMLIFVALAQSIGTEAILGAFLAGVVISLVGQEESSALRRNLDALGYGFFIPIFFVMVGVNLRLDAVFGSPEAWIIVPLLFFLLYPMQILSSLPLRMLGFRWNETFAAGVLLASRLSLPIAAADIGLRLQVISPTIHAAVIIVAILTTTVSPVLYGIILPRIVKVKRTGTIIVGASRIGILLARRLKDQNEQVTLIDNEPDHIAEARRAGLRALLQDGRDMDGLKRAGAEKARSLVALTGSEDVNIQVAQIARNLGIPQVIIMAVQTERHERLRGEGIQIVSPETAALIMLDNILRHPRAFSLFAENGGAKIQEVPLQNNAYAGGRLRDLHLPRGMLVVAILRNQDEKIVPAGDTRLELGDVLLMLGSDEEVQEIKTSLSGRHGT